ncbi:serine hydrolase domain-containing protein [Euzebyella saccharophila]|uniref:Serine hydrolase domain-containing protein n=1 Tax=Euzebyella saccharophila TaxID=679664 RepID=A0ABV8JQD3_9FLAO|nr:serine hydrolase domain-containing protein [Euzebyella saccharophila]
MNPIKKIIDSFFSRKRVLGQDIKLTGLAKADALLNDLVNEEKVPSLAISVLKDGKPFFQKGYGFADLESKKRIDPEHSVFRIASVSKPIAATALAHMVADGLIDLDASLYDYVPYFPKKKWDFTIRQLAGHTAGIRGYQGIEYGLNQPYSIKKGIDIFKGDDLLFKPGTGYHYNSFDWVLISLAMQEASGIPFETYVYGKVLRPLGLNSTFAPTVQNSISKQFQKAMEKNALLHTTTFYSKGRNGFRLAKEVNNHYKLAGGGYLSTTTDIAKFGQAYLENQILDPKILQPFLSAGDVNGTSTSYGLGWQVSSDFKGRPYFGHVGNGVGGYSNFYVYPKEKMVFSILINCTDPKVQELLDLVVASLI